MLSFVYVNPHGFYTFEAELAVDGVYGILNAASSFAHCKKENRP